MLEKDWFSYDWVMSFDHHCRIERPQGVFHCVGQKFEISPEKANIIVDAILLGKLQTIDLRQYKVNQRVDKILARGALKR